MVAEERHDRRKPVNDEEHLVASRCAYHWTFEMPAKAHDQRTVYRPNLRAKSDTDILRDAKLEAMGLPPQDDLHRRSNQERVQMATDEMVGLHNYKFFFLLNNTFIGDGALQETYAEMISFLGFQMLDVS